MKLIVIASEKHLPEEQALLVEMFRSGLEIFHLRKPQAGIEVYRDFLEGIPEEFHDRIALHDYYELSETYAVRGIHLNERNKSQWESFASKAANTSVSCHSLEELQHVDPMMNYAFLSPVFNSISKVGYEQAFEPKELEKPFGTTVPVIALGGVCASNVETCIDWGFDGVAVLGAIWQSNDPIQEFKAIRNTCLANESTY